MWLTIDQHISSRFRSSTYDSLLQNTISLSISFGRHRTEIQDSVEFFPAVSVQKFRVSEFCFISAIPSCNVLLFIVNSVDSLVHRSSLVRPGERVKITSVFNFPLTFFPDIVPCARSTYEYVQVYIHTDA